MEELQELKKFGIEADGINTCQILCLPENIDTASNQSELIDAGDTADLSKLLKEQGVKCANSYDIGLESSTLERRGVDIWLGCIWILNHAAVPVLVSVVGQLVGKRLQEKFSSAKELKSSDRAKVHADVKLLEGKVSASIKYEGDAETFLKVLEGLNKNDTELKN